MTTAENWRKRLADARRVVIKIGSRALVNSKGKLDRRVFSSVSDGVAMLKRDAAEVAVVSSGSVLAGRSKLGLMHRELTMPQKQAAAAVGQNHLITEWARSLGRHGLMAGQILLTAEDLGDRSRYLNSRNTLEELFRLDVVPVINENDTVAVEEIRYGDNDHISTLIVGMMEADLLILLTDIDGFYAQDPSVDPQAEILVSVRESDSRLFDNAGPSKSGVGSGGMATKIEAARTVARRGVPTVIANGKRDGIIEDIIRGKEKGTLFVPEGEMMKSRQYWMAFAGEARGDVIIDEGAIKALEGRHTSLLSRGVTGVSGPFRKGDLVKVVSRDGTEVARGLTHYSHEDLEKIKGLKSSEIEGVLGQNLYDEIIHRDHMVLTRKKRPA